ncbi:dolichol phosphate-mannose biosynthesis regulatory [Pyrrhoderma noxium]|uniref:Dolichol phosphate-mannose biosynthesis regulatory protein n=1 Tax=Pyrrhoderma noxium TaxID=2282107 RepID=A0A286UUG5_9AGAM|nr:dolichol phosphate-mannose biosynthesis regulatory [Pyrrhoderma noxium]
MAFSDKVLGGGMIFVALFVFTYYTIWAGLLPFLDKSNPLHDLFPAREWAVRLPAFLFVVGLASVGLFIGSTIIKENRKKALKARQRTA